MQGFGFTPGRLPVTILILLGRRDTMKVFIVGGTGLLGSFAAKEFVKKGHSVSTVSLPGLPPGADFPAEMNIIEGNYNEMTDQELAELFTGFDCFVFAAGVDERVDFPKPVYDSYYKYNVVPVERMLKIGKSVGMTKAVILGSYFSFFNRYFPELELAKHHPYVRSRIEQERVALSFTEDGKMDVCVLELPYIFGTQPGRKPLWTMLTGRIKKMGPVTMYPKGGTAMITVRQVGEVIVGAAEKNKGGNVYPIGMYNYTWNDFLDKVHIAMGMPGRKIINIPKWMFQAYAMNNDRHLQKENKEMGLNPVRLADIMCTKAYVDNAWAKWLGATEDDMDGAIMESIKASVEADSNSGKFMDMRVK